VGVSAGWVYVGRDGGLHVMKHVLFDFFMFPANVWTYLMCQIFHCDIDVYVTFDEPGDDEPNG
jgi:hypothetical protein